MAKYTGADCRLCRREGCKLFLKGERCTSKKCAMERRVGAPGVHPTTRKKPSEYLLQLREKQKVKRAYGLLEKQFRGYYDEAARQKGKTGEVMLSLLERRLDNVCYRLGLGASRAQARQIVNHTHITVNGKKMDIPSYICKPGDVIALKETSKNLAVVKASRELVVTLPAFVTWDDEKACGTYVRVPERNEICHDIHENLIVEFYNKKI